MFIKRYKIAQDTKDNSSAIHSKSALGLQMPERTNLASGFASHPVYVTTDNTAVAHCFQVHPLKLSS